MFRIYVHICVQHSCRNNPNDTNDSRGKRKRLTGRYTTSRYLRIANVCAWLSRTWYSLRHACAQSRCSSFYPTSCIVLHDTLLFLFFVKYTPSTNNELIQESYIFGVAVEPFRNNSTVLSHKKVCLYHILVCLLVMFISYIGMLSSYI